MVELRIKWDGPLPGLSEHRLSVAAFAIPLRKLLTAIRRTANNMLREADQRKATDVGRFAAEADRIDLQIASVLEGSSGVQSVVSVEIPPGQMGFWPEGLAEDAVDRLLSDIDRESRGIRRNSRARNYLEALPPALTSQDYWLYVDGDERRHVHLSSVALPTDLNSVPFLVEFVGRVISVGFPPGRSFVRIQTLKDGSEVTFSCSQDEVSAALELHAGDVRVMGLVRDDVKRLLRIQAVHQPRVKLDEKSWVFDSWHSVLERLAK
jgi:hypothetical protein